MSTAHKFESVYAQLRGRIESKEFAVGSTFPTEVQLCGELDASRYAVRGALEKLEKEGLLKRRRGAGTTVVRHSPIEAFRHAVGSRTDLLNYTRETRVEWGTLEIVRADGALARLLGCDEMREWQCLEGIRFDSQDVPLCLVKVYVDAARATIPTHAPFPNEPVYQWLEKKPGIKSSGLSQDIRAKMLTPMESAGLGEPVGVCSLQIIRRYFDSDNGIYMISVNTFRSRDFVYNMRLELRD